MAQNAKVPECSKFFEDERLEDAFKTPVCNEEGYSDPLPTIYNDMVMVKTRTVFSFLPLEALLW